jgi:lipopolysaccharide/colanic/teichoic acid biosynthesis glycosyltransferase
MHSVAKRALDIIGAIAGLLLCAPIAVLTALAIRITMREPVLFRQQRPGQHERLLSLLKFRTMRTATDHGRTVPDSERLTRLGRLLRSTSVDEIPQLWNVLKGDMSLVGPRPLLPEYLPRYNDFQRRRHEIKPGITGWAQVNGRNAQTWEQKFEFDVWYIDHWSIGLDLAILWMTIAKVLQRDGISQHGHATMPEFQGTGRR